MDLSDLTIVITSRNRPEKLKRVVHHLEMFGFKGKLLIGDASDFKNAIPFQNFLKTSILNIDYFPQEGMSVVNSHQYLATKITTKYSLCIADGALVILDGIKECIKELEQNKELIAVSGQTFTYEYKKTTNFRICHYEMPIIKNSKPLDRFKNICDKYRVAMYCVMYTNSWIKIWQKVENISIGLLAGEIVPTLRLVIEGKIAQVNAPYLIRELHSKRTCKEPINILLDENFSEAYDLSLKDINNEIKILEPNISNKKIKSLFDKVIYTNKKEKIFTSSFYSILKNLYIVFTSLDLTNKIITNIKIGLFKKKFSWSYYHMNLLKKIVLYLREYKKE